MTGYNERIKQLIKDMQYKAKHIKARFEPQEFEEVAQVMQNYLELRQAIRELLVKHGVIEMKCKYCKWYYDGLCIGCGENKLVNGEDEGCTNYETNQEGKDAGKNS